MKQVLWNLIKICISVGLILYIFLFQVDIQEVWKILLSARWLPLLFGALIMVFGIVLRAYRWQILIKALNIHLPLSQLTYFYFLGAFFSMFLPSGIGGDAVKMAKLSQSTGKIPESIGTTLVERATGLWVLFILALFALPFSMSYLPTEWIPFITIVTISGVIGGWLVMGTPLIPWIGKKIKLPYQDSMVRFYHSVSELGWRALTFACFISLVFDLFLILLVDLIAISLGVSLPVGVFFLFTPIISFSLIIPISVGGLGVREQTFILLFQAVGIPPDIATTMSLLFYLLTTILTGLIGGGLYIIATINYSINRGKNA